MTAEKRKGLARGEVVLLISTVALVVPIVAGAFWAQANREMPRYNIPKNAMPSPNARDNYLAATKLISRQAGNLVGTSTAKNYTAAQRAAVVAQDAPGLAEVRKGFAHAYMNPNVRSFTTLLPELAEFRELARAFALSSAVKAERGDNAGAAKDALDCLRFGVDIPKGGTIIHSLVGIAIEAIGRAQLWKVVRKLSPAEARSALARLEEIEARRVSLTEMLTEEKWVGLASVLEIMKGPGGVTAFVNQSQSSFGNSGNSSGTTIDAFRAVMAASFFDKRKAVENYVAYQDANIARMAQPYAPNRPKIPVPDDPLNQFVALDTFDSIQVKHLGTVMDTALLRVTLALSAYRRERGGYPATLTELVTAKYLTALPDDPFSPGNPPRYRLDSPTKYLLYSVGPDAKDDGGKPVLNPRSVGNVPAGRPANFVEIGVPGDYVVHVNTRDAPP
jgi:hypothetical protein